MPAVTTDNILALDRIAEPDRATSVDRPVESVTTAPQGFEGEGFPVYRAFAGVDPRRLDPFIHMDQMGEVDYAPGRAEGHVVASASRVRDGDLHDRRDHAAPGLHRRRRQDHRRGDAMDDRRRGHPAHRDTAGAPRRIRRAVPRHPAVGQPAGVGEVGGAAIPGHRERRRHPAHVTRRRRADPCDRRRHRRPQGPGLDPDADLVAPRHAQPGRGAPAAVAGRLQRAGLRACPAPVRSATSDGRCRAANSR